MISTVFSQDTVRQTRARYMAQVECLFPQCEAFKKSVSYTGPRYWEILPGRLKMILELKAFKAEIKRFHRDSFIEEGFV